MRSTGSTRPLWALLALAAALAGCSSGPLTGASAPAASSGGGFSDRMNNLFFGSPPPAQAQGPGTAEEPDCPPVDIRTGASTVTVHGASEQVATNVRYQATIAQTARECAVLGATMTIKVGVQGRVVLGPLGGPGQLDLPLRLALVHEGPDPKTIWTKLYRIAVPIPAGQTNVPFVHVEEDMTFPVPKGADLESYIVYVGFDQAAPKPVARAKRTRPAR